jgi:hypothetical protein
VFYPSALETLLLAQAVALNYQSVNQAVALAVTCSCRLVQLLIRRLRLVVICD